MAIEKKITVNGQELFVEFRRESFTFYCEYGGESFSGGSLDDVRNKLKAIVPKQEKATDAKDKPKKMVEVSIYEGGGFFEHGTLYGVHNLTHNGLVRLASGESKQIRKWDMSRAFRRLSEQEEARLKELHAATVKAENEQTEFIESLPRLGDDWKSLLK